MGLSIFISHKDSICNWVESFAIVRLRRELEWGFDIAWGSVDSKCNAFPRLSKWE